MYVISVTDMCKKCTVKISVTDMLSMLCSCLPGTGSIRVLQGQSMFGT